MKVYRIWCKEQITSGGFCEHYDEPTTMIYTTYEKALEHLPKYSSTSWGDYRKYYIKEDEIE